ncbi:hypothetical protein EV182_000697 [Spiromyces aspiralis]|uniref:Uncharacterized protein n=1 Tax=Spiromyces aspiralis TaxID=68401 RepID=A0ACC1HKQ4_9FUNG|nr:hypothetical protein EV182_000697 [Spiromyces aspiralis]
MSQNYESPIYIPIEAPPELAAGLANLSLGPNAHRIDYKYQRLLNLFRRHALSNKRKAMLRRRALHATPATKSIKSGTTPAHGEKKGLLSTSAASKGRVAVGNENIWEEEIISPTLLNNMLETSDNPDEKTFKRRVADLLSLALEDQAPLGEENLFIERLSGAMTNSVYRITVIHPTPSDGGANAHTEAGSGPTNKPKYLLRVYGIGVDEFLIRNQELYWLRQLSELNIGPHPYAIFGNGRIEEYLESATLNEGDIRDPSTSRHIARRMCELHWLVNFYAPHAEKTPEEKLDPMLKGVDLSGKPQLWINLDHWHQLLREKVDTLRRVCHNNQECLEIIENLGQLREDTERLKEAIRRVNSPIVFSHNDLQYGNILRLTKDNELVVVDFEYAGYNYRGFDIVNHFCEWMSNYNHPTHPHAFDISQYPTKQERYRFLRTYLKTKIFLDANRPADRHIVESEETEEPYVTKSHMIPVHIDTEYLDQQVPLLDEEVQSFFAARLLHWGVWGLLQACSSDIDFNYVEYANQHLREFRKALPELLAKFSLDGNLASS